MDWRTGEGTAKYWVNRLLIESVSMGDAFRATSTNSSAVHAQGFTHGHERRVLLVNKRNEVATVVVDGALTARVVDELTHQGPPREETLQGGAVTLRPFATAVVAVRSWNLAFRMYTHRPPSTVSDTF